MRIGSWFLTISAVLALSASALGQGATKIRSVTTLPAACSPGSGTVAADMVSLFSSGTSFLYECSASNTWALVGTFPTSGTGFLYLNSGLPSIAPAPSAQVATSTVASPVAGTFYRMECVSACAVTLPTSLPAQPNWGIVVQNNSGANAVTLTTPGSIQLNESSSNMTVPLGSSVFVGVSGTEYVATNAAAMQNYANAFVGNQSISGNLQVTGNITVTGTLNMTCSTCGNQTTFTLNTVALSNPGAGFSGFGFDTTGNGGKFTIWENGVQSVPSTVMAAETSRALAAEALLAPLASPTFTGAVNLPATSAADSSSKAATTAFVQNLLSGNTNFKQLKCAASGTANALTCSATAGYVYTANDLWQVTVASNNTGSATLQVNSLSLITIKKLQGGANLASGDLVAGGVATMVYDGTNFQLLSQTGNSSATLSGTGLVRQTGVATEIGGDGTTSGNNTLVLATVNAGPGSCGDSTHVCQVTTNGKGLVTGQTAVAITGASTLVGTASDVTAQATSQTTVTLATSPSAGPYRLMLYAALSTVCTTGSNSVTFTLNWTDASNARSLAVGPLTLSAAQAASTFLSLPDLPIYVGSGNVTYTSTVSGACATGTSKYDVHASLRTP